VHFFLYDPWVACYIFFGLFAIAWSIVGLAWVGGTNVNDPCPGDLRSASTAAAIIVLAFLGFGLLMICCTLCAPFLDDLWDDCNPLKCLFCWLYYPFCYKPKPGVPAGPRPNRDQRQQQRAQQRGGRAVGGRGGQAQPQAVIMQAQPVVVQQQQPAYQQQQPVYQQQPPAYQQQQPVVYQAQPVQTQPVYQQQQQQQYAQQPMPSAVYAPQVHQVEGQLAPPVEQPRKTTGEDVKEKVGAAASAVGKAAGQAIGKGFAAAKGLFAKKDDHKDEQPGAGGSSHV